jgi:hypothetical protein
MPEEEVIMKYAEDLKDAAIDIISKEMCLVTFTKVSDGSERKMLCTTCPDNIPDDQLPTEDSSVKINEDIHRVYAIDVDGWRSFRWDSVISIDINPV